MNCLTTNPEENILESQFDFLLNIFIQHFNFPEEKVKVFLNDFQNGRKEVMKYVNISWNESSNYIKKIDDLRKEIK